MWETFFTAGFFLVAETDAFAEHLVRADEDVDFARLQVGGDL